VNPINLGRSPTTPEACPSRLTIRSDLKASAANAPEINWRADLQVVERH
jgi:hypothetical protein